MFKLNHLADTTGEEFIATYANKIPSKKTPIKGPENLKSPAKPLGLRVDDYNLDLLDREHPLRGAVNNSKYIAEPKRSQGFTSTCYSFALSNAIGAAVNLALDKRMNNGRLSKSQQAMVQVSA